MSTLEAKILIVDDEIDLCEFMKCELEDQGFQCFAAHSADEALRIYGKERPDIVISDVRMPKKNGVQLLQEIRATGNYPIFVFMTGFSDVSLKEVYQQGACGLFAKPLDLELLTVFLRKSLTVLSETDAFGQRDSLRVKTEINANLVARSHGQIYPAIIRNLSRSGAYFEMTVGPAPQVGEVVDFIFHDPQKKLSPIEGYGTCMWARISQDGKQSFGMRIDDISSETFESFFISVTTFGVLPATIQESRRGPKLKKSVS